MKETTPARTKSPDQLQVALERTVAEIERELGPLDLVQRIAVTNAVADLAAVVKAMHSWIPNW